MSNLRDVNGEVVQAASQETVRLLDHAVTGYARARRDTGWSEADVIRFAQPAAHRCYLALLQTGLVAGGREIMADKPEVAAIEADLPAGVVVAGSSFRGIGIASCIRQGREAARATVARQGEPAKLSG